MVTSADLAPSFSGTGLAAQSNPKFKKKQKKTVRRNKVRHLYPGFINPPKLEFMVCSHYKIQPLIYQNL
jgi:hypothetical protein